MQTIANLPSARATPLISGLSLTPRVCIRGGPTPNFVSVRRIWNRTTYSSLRPARNSIPPCGFRASWFISPSEGITIKPHTYVRFHCLHAAIKADETYSASQPAPFELYDTLCGESRNTFSPKRYSHLYTTRAAVVFLKLSHRDCYTLSWKCTRHSL